MKPIQIIIIAIFIVSGILGFLLFRQKAGRVKEQLDKKELGWNPVSVKKMFVLEQGRDTLWWAKQDGVWNTNRHFDGMGTAQQLLIYMSTMQIQASKKIVSDSLKLFERPLVLCTFDKNGALINRLLIGSDAGIGKSYAFINDEKQTVELNSPNNQLSIRKLLEGFLAME